jgi:hypothetical protein
MAVALAASPASSALANGPHHGPNNGAYYGNPFYGLASAIVGTAAAIVTLPFAIVNAAIRAPGYYAPAPGYAPAYGAPPAYGAGPAYGAAPAYGDAPGYAPPSAYYPVRPAYYGGYRGQGSYAAPNTGHYANQYPSRPAAYAQRNGGNTPNYNQGTSPRPTYGPPSVAYNTPAGRPYNYPPH